MVFLCEMRNGCRLCNAFKALFRLFQLAHPRAEVERYSEVTALYTPPKRAYKPRVKKPAK